MCGRYFFTYEAAQEVLGLTDLLDTRSQAVGEGDVHPTDMAWVICADAKKQGLVLASMRWGFPGRQSHIIFNARAESAMEKSLFRDSMLFRRCVIPAGGFYEWNSRKEKVSFTGQEKRILYMAGFYRCFEEVNCFVIITTKANESMRAVHDRMPLILKKEAVKDWILRNDRVEELLTQVPPSLSSYQEYEQQKFEWN